MISYREAELLAIQKQRRPLTKTEIENANHGGFYVNEVCFVNIHPGNS